MTSLSTDTGAMPTGARQWAGLSFALLAGQFMTVIMLAASMAPGYDVATTAISDLGIIPQTAPLFNASLILTGALNVLGAVALFSHDHRVAPLAAAALAGLGAAGAGFITLATPGIHGIFALLAFVLFNLQALLGAATTQGALRIAGWGLGLVGLGYVVIMFLGDSGNTQVFGAIGHGGTERMIVYPPMLWLLVYGGALLGAGPRK